MYARAAAGHATFPALMRLLPDVLLG